MGTRGPKPGRPEMPLRKDPDRQATFLRVLAETGNLREAARQASPHSDAGCMSSFKSYMRDSPEFSAKTQEALDDFRESLVKAAVQRGRDGVPRPIYQRGALVGFEQVYSDNLLLAELRKHFPAEYAQKYDVNHKVMIQPAGAWQITMEDLSHLSQDEKKTLASVMDRVRAGRGERKAIEHKQSIEDAEFETVEDDEHEFCAFDLGYDE